MRSKKILSFIQYFIFIAAGAVLVWWQLHALTEKEKQESIDAIMHVNYWFLIPIAVMIILSHLSRSMRWKILMEPLGYYPSLKNAFAVTMVGYLVNSALPRVGEIVKCTLLAKYEKLESEKLLGTIVVERIFDMLCFIFLAFITLVFQIERVNFFLEENLKSGNNGGFALKIIFVVLTIVVVIILFFILKKNYSQNKLLARLITFTGRFAEGFSSILKLKKRSLFMLHTCFIWTMYLFQIYIGFYALSGTTGLGLSAALSVLIFASIAMIITPGGLGSFPLLVMKVLLLYGISSATGQAFGWMMWSASTALIIIGGLTCLIVLPFINKNYEANPSPTG